MASYESLPPKRYLMLGKSHLRALTHLPPDQNAFFCKSVHFLPCRVMLFNVEINTCRLPVLVEIKNNG